MYFCINPGGEESTAKEEKRLQPQQLQDDKALGTLPQFRVSPEFDHSQGDRVSPITANNAEGIPDNLEALPTFSSYHTPSSRLAEM